MGKINQGKVRPTDFPLTDVITLLYHIFIMALVKKFTKIGNSTGIILPADILKVAGMNEDSEVEVEVKGHQIVLSPANLKDHKVMKTFLKVIQDYGETFKKLAK
jgi:antitoxin component of MazEF toxin-antitoxin module